VGTVVVTITAEPRDKISIVAQVPFSSVNWDQPQTINVQAVDNKDVEGLVVGTIRHTISNVSTDVEYRKLNLSAMDITVLITDNDQPALSVTPRVLNVLEGDLLGAVYEVTMQTTPADFIVVNITAPPSLQVVTVGTGESFLYFDRNNWDRAQDVKVVATDNFVSEGDRTFAISHFITTTDPTYSVLNEGVQAPWAVTVGVADDDTADLAYVEALTGNEGGGDVEFVIGLRTIPTADVRAYLTLDQSTYLTFKNVQTDGGERFVSWRQDEWRDTRTVLVSALADSAFQDVTDSARA